MKLLLKTALALFLSFLSFSASAQYNVIDSGIQTIIFEEDKKTSNPDEEPECD